MEHGLAPEHLPANQTEDWQDSGWSLAASLTKVLFYAPAPGPGWVPGRLTRDSRVVSLEIPDSWLTTTPRSGPAGPEPKFLSKFIFGPEPDSAPYDFFLTTPHRSSKNRFFENLYKSLFLNKNMARNPPEHAQIIPT